MTRKNVPREKIPWFPAITFPDLEAITDLIRRLRTEG
jgi:hypothetical protein